MHQIHICQQGFQFFPDKKHCAKEIHRVLRDSGKFVATTWLPVADCQFFGIICEALEAIDESDISAKMRVPFDYMPTSELTSAFEESGFIDVRVSQQEQDMVIRGIGTSPLDLAYVTPIGPALRALSDDVEAEFKRSFNLKIDAISHDGLNLGRMVTNVLTSQKPDRPALA